MSSKININGHDFCKTQIGVSEFKVSVFLADKLTLQFNVSLQPAGKDDVLPSYQLIDKSQSLPKWITDNLNIISDWVIRTPKS